MNSCIITHYFSTVASVLIAGVGLETSEYQMNENDIEKYITNICPTMVV